MDIESLPVYPSSDALALAAKQGLLTLRVRAADALLTHYEVTHGVVGQHDHHCEAPDEGCTCGWTLAEWAIGRYEEAVRVSQTP